ncbi:hypothetical protein JNUCC31_24140 [Paenibacillus sp. JNUCC31]|uniref:DUF4129 domain-containing protein n=1 Tax=Paenibacillus sp. JNUCC-31 TaxID=2777983 RepID=UPI001780E860|nr:DUF4129 domain-containing protein [Paenibacillus sp. JNUCC-31]QOS77813.1 hypothetical protein JNUCC31_24140 [Paenibacillus sp. JNUCC-31]
MSDSKSSKESLILSILAVLLIGVYLYPFLTLTSLYTAGHLPYTLIGIFVVAGSLGQWVQHRLPVISEKNTFIRWGAALIMGLLISLIIALVLGLPLPDLLTAAVWGVISAYVGLNFQPVFRSILIWRLQIFGVLTAIVWSGAANSLEFMQPLQAYAGTVYAAGVISFAGWLVGQYSVQLDRAILNDGQRRIVLREFARANHQRLVWMLIVIAGIGAFPSLVAWLGPLRDRLLAWIRGLLGSSSNQDVPITPTAPNEPPLLPEGMEASGEPSVFWDILGWIVMGAVAVVVLWLILRLGQKAINKLMDRFKGMLQPGQKKIEPRTEYVDISETLEAPARTRKSWFRKKESLPSKDAERVRYYYRKWIDRAAARGVDIQSAHTPLEAAEAIVQHGVREDDQKLSAMLPDSYNAVRYGKKTPDDSEMSEIDRIWKSYRSK